MAKRETKWHETNRLNPFRPNEGQISSDRKHVWNGKKWVKYIGPPKKVKVSSEEFFGTNKYGSGGPKESKPSTTSNKTKPSTTSNKTKPKSSNKNRNKLNVSFGTGLKIASDSFKSKPKSSKSKPKSSDTKTKKDQPQSTVFTRHYKTGKPLGVMSGAQRRKYDKEAAGRTFESEVAAHEKSSGHGKSHKRETLYKASLRKKGKDKTPVSKGPPPKRVEITNKNKFKVDTKDIPKDKVDLEDGRVVDRSSLYGNKKKKKKKKPELFKGLSEMFDN